MFVVVAVSANGMEYCNRTELPSNGYYNVSNNLQNFNRKQLLASGRHTVVKSIGYGPEGIGVLPGLSGFTDSLQKTETKTLNPNSYDEFEILMKRKYEA
ncbi:hypothetical protein EVAR_70467_1 [Eumeta japonica]|uniref:Uncharacterized protein n=1 Tax=Eumeta variegata TaxID=151549 RepID=A0A4C2A7T4_EUMVA|nr:hypothetical protein EVAR_70467_1 [Eumeta japonica]